MSSHSPYLSKPFPSCPEPKNRPLPFGIDEMKFSGWLDKLSQADELIKCNESLHVLQTLNYSYLPGRKAIPGRTRLFMLDKLSAILVVSTLVLTQTNQSVEENAPAREIDTAICEIAVWCWLELANGYMLLSKEDWFTADTYYSLEEKSAIIASGIKCLSRALLHISQTYAKTVDHFWRQCFQFYCHAQHYRLTDSEFNPDAAAIQNNFKQLLVFSLSNTNQFSPHEMRIIFDLLGHYSGYAKLLKSVPKKKFKGIPAINLKGDDAPAVENIQEDAEDGANKIYIATVALASQILESMNDKTVRYLPPDRIMMMRLAKTLALNEQRKDIRENENKTQISLIGFEVIHDYLAKKEAESQGLILVDENLSQVKPGEIRDLNMQISPAVEEWGNAEIEPHSGQDLSLSFQVIEFTDSNEIWNKASAQKDAVVQVLNRSAKGYGLLWTDKKVNPKVGSLVGVVQQNLVIGLVRWLTQSKETGMFMGVEVLGENAATATASNPGFPEEEAPAIYIPGNDSQPTVSIVFRAKGFVPNEFFFVTSQHKSQRYRIVKQLHLTRFVNHIEVVRSY